MSRIYVAPKLMKWENNIEIDVGNATFKPPMRSGGGPIGFLEAFDNIEEYNRKWPEDDPVIFTIADVKESEIEKKEE